MTRLLELESYFARVGFRGKPRADLETLSALHFLHPIAIPFENLSTLLGERVRLDFESLRKKLIDLGRGGYCFEQNTLFQWALETIGFSLVPLAARVVWNQRPDAVNPRTHMALLVQVGRDKYLCDVGFGAVTLTAPLHFLPDVVQETPHERFRIRSAGPLNVLEVELDERWRPAYEFDLQPQQPIDYEAMNHFVQSHPSSHFRHVLMAGRPDTTGRFSLGRNELSRYERGRLIDRRRIPSAPELAALLRDELRIALPPSSGLDPLLERIASSPGR